VLSRTIHEYSAASANVHDWFRDPQAVGAVKYRRIKARPWITIPVVASGILLVLLGGGVLWGWIAGSALLVRMLPNGPPFRVDLAIAFMLGGAALALVPTGHERWASRLGLGVVALAVLAAAKHFVGEPDLLLDHLFPDHPASVDAYYSSRMSAASALTTLIAGLGIVIVARRPTASFVLGMMTAVLGLIELTGHALAGGAALQWDGSRGGAMHASFGFVVLGAGLVMESRRRSTVGGRRRVEPYLVGVVTALGAALFWQSLVQQEILQLRSLLNATAIGIRSTLSGRLSDITSSLEIFAAESERIRAQAESWPASVQIVMANHPSIVALWWLKNDGTPIATEWRPEHRGARISEPPDEAERAALALTEARHSRRAIVGRVGPLQENDGRPSLRILTPLRRRADADLLIAVVDIATFARDALAGTQNENAVTILAGEEVLFRSVGTASRAERRSVERRSLTLPLSGGAEWTIAVGPSAVQAATRSSIPAITLLAGLVISALLVSALHASELDRASARQLAAALRQLESQARQLRDADRRLRELNEDLERRVVERTTQLTRANEVLEKENRLRLRAQLRLSSANQNLREFDAFISHELRQPLAAMRLWVDLLESTDPEKLSEKHRGYVEKVSVEVGRMGELIENELTLSKTSGGDTATEPVRLDDVLEELRQSMAPRLAEVEGEIRFGELPTVLADPRQMRQLFLNLIDNAIKYRRPEEPLLIQVQTTDQHRGDFAETYGDEYCEIVVEDNGRGVAADKGGEIFEMFRRVGDNNAVSGSGVGLSVCRRIVERHDGTIFADTAPERGARFHVVLPLAEPPPS
jgi:signal transduction histidine kinase